MWWWKQVAGISHTSGMLTVLFYGRPYSKPPRKTWGHNNKKVISSQLPEAYSFLLINPVMSPSARLCHSFTASIPPSLCSLSVCLSVCSASATKNNTCVHSVFVFQGWLTLKRRREGKWNRSGKDDDEVWGLLSSVLSSGKCAANEIEVLNQICSAWVIECCFEERACLYVGTDVGTRMESLCRGLAASSDSWW